MQITKCLPRIILPFSPPAHSWSPLHCPWNLGLPVPQWWVLLRPVWKNFLLRLWFNHWGWTLAIETTLSWSWLWQQRWVADAPTDTYILHLNLKHYFSQVLSHRQTTLETILIAWGWRTKYKWSRDWWSYCNSLTSLPRKMQTGWHSRMATEQPWWGGPVVSLCQPISQAGQMSSTSSSAQTIVLRARVGVSAGVQWHQVG